MKGFDVLKVKSAVKSHNKFDLSRSHLTTMEFGQIVPLLAEETVPGDKFSINAEYFSRLAPLVKPTYGKFQFKTVSGFVPYHQIAFDADAWIGGKTTFEGQTPHQRWIRMGELMSFFFNQCSVGGTSNDCAFSYVDSSGAQQYRKWTNKGRYWAKILNALGYAVPQGLDQQTGSYWLTTYKDVAVSAYPLLAFFKMYNDYMSQSQRFNISQLSAFLQNVKYGRTQVGYQPATGEIILSGITLMFNNLLLNYENDYFTSAWQNPNSALSGAMESVSTMNVPGVSGANWDGRIVSGNDFDAVQLAVNSGSPSTVEIPQRALDFLRSFDDWVRRNNYSGSRAVQQVYSRFGIKTDDYKSHYANIISTDSLPVQVGDVTSTADTTTATLGSYAGKGIMAGNKGISCQVSDYGIILILGYFTVTPMNPYGFDRKVLRSDPLDYYTPEFDGLGADAISLGEYYANAIAVAADTTHDTDVFGFTERYNSYRYGRDQITGEFRDFHTFADMNAWHTGRNLGMVRQLGNLVAQSSSVNTLETNDSQYNRIFSVTNGDVDHFYLTCRFSVDALRPMLNLNQVPRLGEGDTTVPRNGNVIS